MKTKDVEILLENHQRNISLPIVAYLGFTDRIVYKNDIVTDELNNYVVEAFFFFTHSQYAV